MKGPHEVHPSSCRHLAEKVHDIGNKVKQVKKIWIILLSVFIISVMTVKEALRYISRQHNNPVHTNKTELDRKCHL